MKTKEKIKKGRISAIIVILILFTLFAGTVSAKDFIIENKTINMFVVNGSTGNLILIPVSGRVGVGTTEPQYKLGVSDTSADGKTMNISNVFFVNASAGTAGVGVMNATSFLSILGSTTSVSSLRVQAGTAPSSPIVGDVYSDGTDLFFYDGAGWKDLTAETSSAGGWTDEGSVVRLTSVADYVGIGTATPSEKLYVDGNGTFTGDLYLGGSLWGPEDGGIGTVSFGWTDAGTVVYLTTSTDMVGIGTPTPATTLHVNGSGSTAGFKVTNETGDFSFFINASLGRVGINTLTPTQALDVNGHINVTGTSSNSSFSGDVKILGTLYGGSPLKVGGGINVSSSTGSDAFFVSNGSGVKIFRISDKGELNITSAAGNTSYDQGTLFVDAENNMVGIGTVNPLEVLTVVGNANISGMLNATTIYQAGNKVIDTLTLGNGTIIRDSNTSWVVAIGSLWNAANFTSALGGANANLTLLNVSGQALFTSGNVGIGLTTPTHLLTVAGDLNVTGASYLGDIVISADNITLTEIVAKNENISFFNATKDEKMRILYDGRVGIGTKNPEPGYFLHINTTRGEFKVAGKQTVLNSTGWTGAESQLMLIDGDSDNARAIIHAQGNDGAVEALWVSSIGNTGINTTSPAQLLHVQQGNVLFNSTDYPQGFFYSESDGRVGIGTTSPTHALTVAGDLNVTGASYLGDIVIQADNMSVNEIVSRNENISFFNASKNETMRITYDGRVGIGTTTPNKNLHIHSSTHTLVNISGSDGGGYVHGIYVGDPDQQYFMGHYDGDGTNLFAIRDYTATGLPIRMAIDTSGKVGIGTTSPTEALEVHGNITVPGALFVDNTTGKVGIGTTTPVAKLDVRGDITTEPDNYTTLLLHMDGVNTSTTFIDSSSSAHTVTANGNALISYNASKFGGASFYSSVGSGYLSVPASADFNFAASESFTFDFWTRVDAAAATLNNRFFQKCANAADGYVIHIDATDIIFGTAGTELMQFPRSEVIGTGKWHHIALVRDTSTVKMYLDGVEKNSTTLADALTGSCSLEIARYPGGEGDRFDGYIDEFRVSKGIARWTSDFIPPERPYDTVEDNFFAKQDSLFSAVKATAAGNVGIGTTSPGNKLDVRGNKSAPSYGMTGQINIVDTNPTAKAGVGGAIQFSNAYTADGQILPYARIETLKESAAVYSAATWWDTSMRFMVSNTVANDIVERMRITSAGNVGIGTKNPEAELHVNSSGSITMLTIDNTAADGDPTLNLSVNGGDSYILYADDSVTGDPFVLRRGAASTAALEYNNNNVGRWCMGCTGQPSGKLHIDTAGSGDYTLYVEQSHASNPGHMVYLDFSVDTPDDNTDAFIYGEDATAARFYIFSDGDMKNDDGTYTTIASDGRLKRNIVDTTPKLEKLMQVKVRDFNKVVGNGSSGIVEDELSTGVVTQELEHLFPELVMESPLEAPEGESPYMTVKQSHFIYVLIKALQELKLEKDAEIEEQQSQIEQLQQKINELESK